MAQEKSFIKTVKVSIMTASGRAYAFPLAFWKDDHAYNQDMPIRTEAHNPVQDIPSSGMVGVAVWFLRCLYPLGHHAYLVLWESLPRGTGAQTACGAGGGYSASSCAEELKKTFN